MKSYMIQTFKSEFFAIELMKKVLDAPTISARHHTIDNTNSPVDFSLLDITFDVKCSRPSLTSSVKKKKVWDFDLKYLKEYCDYVLLIGLVGNDPSKVFLIPHKELPTRHVRVSIEGSSKWHGYCIWSKL